MKRRVCSPGCEGEGRATRRFLTRETTKITRVSSALAASDCNCVTANRVTNLIGCCGGSRRPRRAVTYLTTLYAIPAGLSRSQVCRGFFVKKLSLISAWEAVREFDILNSRSGLNNEKWRERPDESGRFDGGKYIRLQSEHIRERINQFGGKLYLNLAASSLTIITRRACCRASRRITRSKMLLALRDQAEIVIAINAGRYRKNKRRGDLGITYDKDVARLIDVFRGFGLYVGSIALTQYAGQPAADVFEKRMQALGLVYRQYRIPNYPADVRLVVSDEGYGRNDYIETTRSLVVVTAPGPGSGKMATCLSALPRAQSAA